MLFAGLETERLGAYFIPTLGPAPKWCHFLDSLTEEMVRGNARDRPVSSISVIPACARPVCAWTRACGTRPRAAVRSTRRGGLQRFCSASILLPVTPSKLLSTVLRYTSHIAHRSLTFGWHSWIGGAAQ